jgi:hypothetical protein
MNQETNAGSHPRTKLRANVMESQSQETARLRDVWMCDLAIQQIA